MPEEDLVVADVERVLWGDDGVVWGDAEGRAAIATVRRGDIGFVRLLAVAPGARRAGLARGLVADARERFAAEGVTDVYAGGEAPFYLWPGVDTAWPAALSFFEAAGFARVGIEFNMTFASDFTAAPPNGVRVERTGDGVLAFVDRHWPNWVAEARRAVEAGNCFVAVESASGDVVGFIGHSVNRAGWLGPMGTDPTRQHGGVGTALVVAVAADARAAGRDAVEIAWVGPVGFYVKAVGATVSRTFVRMRSRISR